MADEADITADRDEAEMPMRLAMSRRDPGPATNGHCHFCDDPVAPGLHYCDTDCAADHSRAQRALSRNRS